MNKEEIIQKASDFEQELKELSRKYGVSSFSFISFFDDGTGEAGYPVMLAWVREGTASHRSHAVITDRAFRAGVFVVRTLTHANEIYKDYYTDDTPDL